MTPTQDVAVLTLPPPRHPDGCRDGPAGTVGAPGSLEQLSAMLWAAFGRSCHGSGGRLPPARAWRGLDLYVCRRDGCFRYDLREHALVPVTPHDCRALAGWYGAGAAPPLVLVYVASVADDDDWEESGRIPGTEASAVAGNVAAWCAARGVATHGQEWSEPHLPRLLRLAPTQRIALTQGIGGRPRVH